ncbi:MAG: hypothetical protein AVDCRST_MAG12-1452, partial [uncultured Rubrobacteraceae bacterium]
PWSRRSPTPPRRGRRPTSKTSSTAPRASGGSPN